MSTRGVVRSVDSMGRVVIPKEMREKLNIRNNTDSFEIFMEGNAIVLRRYNPACIFCDSFEKLSNYKGYAVCSDCIEKLQTAEPMEKEQV